MGRQSLICGGLPGGRERVQHVCLSRASVHSSCGSSGRSVAAAETLSSGAVGDKGMPSGASDQERADLPYSRSHVVRPENCGRLHFGRRRVGSKMTDTGFRHAIFSEHRYLLGPSRWLRLQEQVYRYSSTSSHDLITWVVSDTITLTLDDQTLISMQT